MNKETLLAQISSLNNDEQPFEYLVDGDNITGHWKWMDTRWFSPNTITDEQKEYFFTVTLHNDGTWSEKERNNHNNIKISPNGGLKISSQTSQFRGMSSQKSFNIGLGQNKDTGQIGIINNNFDSSLIKKPLRDLLSSQGWKKRGFFQNLFSK